ncbi:FAD-dependent oxidoreductase, partial [Burkholderia metallica]|uniref:FAD-dependent oxidoreductase n=1 Tax=Burkholderia metallica TaxID=488729 RepID=UPI001CF4B733
GVNSGISGSSATHNSLLILRLAMPQTIRHSQLHVQVVLATLNPDEPLARFGENPDDVGDLSRFVARYLPDAGVLRLGKTCQYIMTPDSDFIIDRLPGYPNVHVATGFSGHGFKFASVLGEALSERVIDGVSRADLSMLSLSR